VIPVERTPDPANNGQPFLHAFQVVGDRRRQADRAFLVAPPGVFLHQAQSNFKAHQPDQILIGAEVLHQPRHQRLHRRDETLADQRPAIRHNGRHRLQAMAGDRLQGLHQSGIAQGALLKDLADPRREFGLGVPPEEGRGDALQQGDDRAMLAQRQQDFHQQARARLLQGGQRSGLAHLQDRLAQHRLQAPAQRGARQIEQLLQHRRIHQVGPVLSQRPFHQPPQHL